MHDLSQRFQALSPEQQQQLLDRLRAKKSTGAPALPTLPAMQADAKGRYAPFPLTDIQSLYWAGRSVLFDLGASGTNVYNEFEIADVDEDFIPHLNRAINQLIARHDMLRAVITPDGQQKVLQHVPYYEVEVRDIRGLDADTAKTCLLSTRATMCTQKGVIDTWPLFHFLVHLKDERRLQLHMRIDTLLMDGSSRILFVRELARLLAHPQTELPPLACSYRDYTLTLQNFQRSVLYQNSRRYWLQRVATLPSAPDLPLKCPVSPSTPAEFVLRDGTLLQEKSWKMLKSRASRTGITASVAITTAFAEVLGRWTNNDHFSLGLVGTNRLPIHEQVYSILGNFNTLSLLEVKRAYPCFKDMASSTQQQVLADLEHRYFSGIHLLREQRRLRGGGSRTGAPVLFNSVIEYSHDAYPEAQIFLNETEDFVLSHITEIEAIANLPQVLFVLTAAETPSGHLVYKSQAVEQVLPDNLIAMLLEDYKQLLEQLAADDDIWHLPVEDLLPCRIPLTMENAVSQEEQLRRLLPAKQDGIDPRRCDLYLSVLDKQLTPTPPWVPGTIYINGRNSLYNNGEKRLKTEYMGCVRPDGAIDILGEENNYLFENLGYNILRSQTEKVIKHYAGVQDAMLVVSPAGTSRARKSIVAYVVPEQNTAFSLDGLRSHVQTHLPLYMCPTDFIVVQHLPLAPEESLQLQLASRRIATHKVQHINVSFLEQRLIKIWEEILDLHDIGVQNNFFASGGTSVQAVQVAYAIERLLHQRISLMTFYQEDATIEQLISQLTSTTEL